MPDSDRVSTQAFGLGLPSKRVGDRLTHPFLLPDTRGTTFMSAPVNVDSVRPISSLKGALIYGIDSLGKIPRRQWNQPPIPSLRRHETTHTREDVLTKLNRDVPPTAFILSTFSGLDEPDSARMAGHAAASGVRLANGDDGQRHTLRQVDVVLTLSATLFTTTLDAQLDYAAQLIEVRKGKGIVGVMTLDAVSLPVSVSINRGFSMTDPVSGLDSASFLDRHHQLSFTASIRTVAATIERSPLLREIEFTTSMPSNGTAVRERTYLNPDDWSL